MATFLMVLHIFVCVILVFVVLIQSGKDGGIGMMGSGGGSSQTVFGSSGGANFFTKFTSATAALFMITSLFLTVTKTGKKSSVFADQPAATAPAPASSPAAEATTAPADAAQAPANNQQAPETKKQ